MKHMRQENMQSNKLPVMAYAEVIGMTIAPTVRSASAKLMMNMLDTWNKKRYVVETIFAVFANVTDCKRDMTITSLYFKIILKINGNGLSPFKVKHISSV